MTNLAVRDSHLMPSQTILSPFALRRLQLARKKNWKIGLGNSLLKSKLDDADLDSLDRCYASIEIATYFVNWAEQFDICEEECHSTSKKGKGKAFQSQGIKKVLAIDLTLHVNVGH